MSYQSPVEIVLGKIRNKQEDYILSVIQEMSVNVDKTELIKALEYDREQYEKGYADGIRMFAERLKAKQIITHKSKEGFCVYEFDDELIDNLVQEMTE